MKSQLIAHFLGIGCYMANGMFGVFGSVFIVHALENTIKSKQTEKE